MQQLKFYNDLYLNLKVHIFLNNQILLITSSPAIPIWAAPKATNVQASKALTFIYSIFLFFDLNFSFLVPLSNSNGSGANEDFNNIFTFFRYSSPRNCYNYFTHKKALNILSLMRKTRKSYAFSRFILAPILPRYSSIFSYPLSK